MGTFTRLTIFSGALAVMHAMACASTSSTAPTDTSDRNEVIGGVDAKSASLDAIGALLYVDPQTNTKQELCTATLIAPRAVLTAKHCAIQKTLAQADGGPAQFVETRYLDVVKISFAIGWDSHAPRRDVDVESVDTCNLADSGMMGMGCDVAIYHLKESIDDVKPLKVATAPPADDTVGQHMTVIGYGIQAEAANTTKVGTRKVGTVTMRALHGAPLKAVFPTVDAFLDAMRASEGEAYVDNYQQDLRTYYETSLLDGYEAYTGGADGDVQICSGDSGGPLLAKVGDELVVQGVASGVTSGARLPCKFGSVHAVFGPKAQDLLHAAMNDPCAGIPPEGRCEGDVAVRCTDSDEGPRRVTRTDCSAALQHCIAPSTPADAGAFVDAGATSTVSCGD